MIWGQSFVRHLSLCLIALLILPVEVFASTGGQAGQQLSPQVQQNGQPTPRQAEGAGATTSGSSSPTGNSNNSPQAGGASQGSQPDSQTPAQAPTTPLGTAAAPETRPLGVPASTPSGAAIAPAKQRRVRKFSIRTALVVGAVVAVGIVAGASLASPSRAGK